MRFYVVHVSTHGRLETFFCCSQPRGRRAPTVSIVDVKFLPMIVTVPYEQVATVWQYVAVLQRSSELNPFSIGLVIVRLYRYLTKFQVLARWSCQSIVTMRSAVPVHPGCLWELWSEWCHFQNFSARSDERLDFAELIGSSWYESGSPFLIKGRWMVRDEPEKTGCM